MTKLSSKTLGAIVVCALIFLFFLPNLLIGKVPIPADDLLGLYHPWRDQTYDGYNIGKFPVKNPLITDPVLQTYPWRNLAVFNIQEGNLPLWNPYSFSGQPLLANIQSSPFQVFNFLFFIFPFKVAWSLQIILPVVLVGLFMFLFLKDLPGSGQGVKLSTTAAIYGGVILPFTGFFLAWMTWGTIITCAMWLPLILLCIHKMFFAKRQTFWFLILVFSASQTVFSGHWQTAFYVFSAATLYLGYLTYQFKKFRSLVISAAAIFFALLISAIQILPSIEFINYSARSIDQGFSAGRVDWFLPYKHLVQLVAPDFFGNPATYNYWGTWNWAEFVSFIGIVPLTFAIFAFLAKEKRAVFFMFLGILSLVLATANPISKIPYVFNFPLISSMQPSRIIYLFVFALAVLASFGLDSFLKKWRGN